MNAEIFIGLVFGIVFLALGYGMYSKEENQDFKSQLQVLTGAGLASIVFLITGALF